MPQEKVIPETTRNPSTMHRTCILGEEDGEVRLTCMRFPAQQVDYIVEITHVIANPSSGGGPESLLVGVGERESFCILLARYHRLRFSEATLPPRPVSILLARVGWYSR